MKAVFPVLVVLGDVDDVSVPDDDECDGQADPEGEVDGGVEQGEGEVGRAGGLAGAVVLSAHPLITQSPSIEHRYTHHNNIKYGFRTFIFYCIFTGKRHS